MLQRAIEILRGGNLSVGMGYGGFFGVFQHFCLGKALLRTDSPIAGVHRVSHRKTYFKSLLKMVSASRARMFRLRGEAQVQWLIAAVMGFLLVGFLLVLTFHVSLNNSRSKDVAAIMLNSSSQGLPSLSDVSSMVVRDFVEQLPGAAQIPQMLRALKVSASSRDILLRNLDVRSTSGDAGSLGRAELILTLRGGDVRVREFLVENLLRFPMVTVRTFRAMRVEVDNVTDAAVTLSIWTKPHRAILSE